MDKGIQNQSDQNRRKQGMENNIAEPNKQPSLLIARGNSARSEGLSEAPQSVSDQSLLFQNNRFTLQQKKVKAQK